MSDQQPTAAPEPASASDIMQAHTVSPGAAERIADAIAAAREDGQGKTASDGAKGADEVLWQADGPPVDGELRLVRDELGAVTIETWSGDHNRWLCREDEDAAELAAHLATLLRDSLAREAAAMAVLNPSMPESGLVDACKQRMTAYLGERSNAVTAIGLLETERAAHEQTKRALDELASENVAIAGVKLLAEQRAVEAEARASRMLPFRRFVEREGRKPCSRVRADRKDCQPDELSPCGPCEARRLLVAKEPKT